MKGSDLRLRLLVAGLGIPLGFAVVWAGGWVLTGTVAILALAGVGEVLGIAKASGGRPFPAVAFATTLLLVGSAGWWGDYGAWAGAGLAILLAATLLTLVLTLFFRGVEGRPLHSCGTTLIAVLYVAVPLSFAIFLRQHPGAAWEAPGWNGSFLLVFPLAVTWLGDSSAYFGGRAWGQRKLFPAVSPAKTVEGGLTGLAGSMLGAGALAHFLLPVMGGGLPLSLMGAATLGLVIGVVAQVGDLAESLLKREAGVKDSGRLLPGHGGVLDRFDAVLLTLPLTYAALPLFLGWSF